MNQNKITKIIATAASTAFLASTVAMETATAATFTYSGDIELLQELTIESEATNLSEALEGGDAIDDLVVKYGLETLELDGDVEDSLLWSNLNAGGMVVKLSYVEATGEWGIYIRERGAFARIYIGGSWGMDDWGVEGSRSVPEPSAAIALGVLGVGAVASRLRRRS